MSATRCKKHIKQSSLDSIQDKTNQKPGQRYLKNTRGGSLDTVLSQGTSGVTDIGRTSSPVLRRKRTGPTRGGSVNQAIPKHVTLDRATFPPPRLRTILRNRSGSADSATLERLRLFIPHRENDEDKAKTDDEAENLERKTSLSTPPAFLVPLLPTDKDEYLYMMVLRTIVNPLGAPDTLPGLTPGELADHVKQVFAIDDLDHGRWMQEVNNNKPANIVLNVTIVEGRNLRPTRAVGGVSAPVDPYCVLCICRPRNTRKASKSATSVPDLGQRSRRRRSSFDPGQVQRTSISSTPNPKWNDAFELSVHDFYEDELEVYIWDNHGGSDSHLGSCPPNKSSGLKSLFRQVKQSVDFGRPADEFIGHFRVPVREISAKGIDTWFDLYQDKKQKKKAKGTCRVRLELSAKESMDFVDGVLDANLSQYCSLEDFYEIVTTLYRHNIDLLLEEALELAEGVPAPELEQLSIQSRAVLDQVAIQQHVSKITQLLLELVVVLEMSCSEKTSQVVANTVVKNVIVALETEWTRIQRSSPGSDDMFSDKLMFTDLELSLFEGAASVYVERAVRNMTDIPKLFPPHELELEDLNNQVSLLVHLLNVHVWSYIDTAQKDLSHLLVQRLQTDVKLWVSAHINNANVASTSKDAVLADTKLMVTVLDEATQVCTPIYTVCQFFAKMGMDYFKTVSLTMESRLALKSQMLMQRMDTYQVTYQKFRVNILESSTLSLQLYMALRNYFNIIRGNIADRDVFRLTISGYQSWFETAVIFWLQTFRDEGQRRMEKALEIDKDVVLVTSLVKYSNSSVDVLSCFSKMTSEWRQIDFSDADICLLGVTKIADTICDGARQYAEKIESILETNGYYDIEQGQRHFDVTDRLCITMNNIEHVRQYLHELPRLLLFDVVTQAMSIKHEDDDVGHQSLNTLHSLVTSADDDIIMRQVLLVRRVTDKMAEETGKYMAKFMRVHERTLGSVDALLDYLETNLKVLDKRLESSIFPYVLHQLWEATLTCFSDTLLNGRPPEYYEQMIEHLRSLKAYFVRGVEEADLLDTPHLMELTARLELNSQTSEQLMLHFLHDIPASMDTPLEYLGSAALRVGCMQETGGNVTIYVTVVSGRQLPGVTRQGLINPYVTLALSPQTLFPHKVARTTTVHKSVNPVFNQTFQFSRIPQEFRLVHGGMLVVTMWHEATLLPDDVIGEVLLHLPDIRMMETHHTVEDLPTQLLPLHRHPEPTSGPYKVLQERSEWDHTASAFIHKRRIQAGYQPVFPFCAPVKALYNMVFGQRGASSGVYGTPPIL